MWGCNVQCKHTNECSHAIDLYLPTKNMYAFHCSLAHVALDLDLISYNELIKCCESFMYSYNKTHRMWIRVAWKPERTEKHLLHVDDMM